MLGHHAREHQHSLGIRQRIHLYLLRYRRLWRQSNWTQATLDLVALGVFALLFLSFLFFYVRPSHNSTQVVPTKLHFTSPGVTSDASAGGRGNGRASRFQHRGDDPTFLPPVTSESAYKAAEEQLPAVINAITTAYSGYERHAFGGDEYGPVTNSRRDWMALGLGIIDSIDLIYMMGGMDASYWRAIEYIRSTFDPKEPDRSQSVFEVIIRILGGLLSIYDLRPDPSVLNKAIDLADALLVAFNTTTGAPYPNVNLHTGEVFYSEERGQGWNLISDTGSLQLEFHRLADLTGHLRFKHAANRAWAATIKVEGGIPGIHKMKFNIQTGETHLNSPSVLGSGTDSFYEYKLKLGLYTGEEAYLSDYERSMQAMHKYIFVKSVDGGALVSEYPGWKQAVQEHLSCFAGGMLALGARGTTYDQDMDMAARITTTCFKSYNMTRSGLAPDSFSLRTKDGYMFPVNARWMLRPETVESLFYMWRTTHNDTYRDWAWQIFQSIEEHCRVGDGYSGIMDVTAKELQLDDVQQSWFLAETLKYFYLIFSPDWVYPLDKWVFNTEAHPFRIRQLPDKPPEYLRHIAKYPAVKT